MVSVAFAGLVVTLVLIGFGAVICDTSRSRSSAKKTSA